MVIYFIILIVLVLLILVRDSNNNDIIRENCKSQADLDNIINAKKTFGKTKLSTILLITSIIILIILLICNFTKLDDLLIDYFSFELYEQKEFNYNLYFIPVYIFIVRQILIEVKTSEFLLKLYQVTEPKLEENPLKSLLFKKKKSQKKEETNDQVK